MSSSSGWGGVSRGNEDDIYSSFENTQYGGNGGGGMSFGGGGKTFGAGGGGLGALSGIGGGGRMVRLCTSNRTLSRCSCGGDGDVCDGVASCGNAPA